MTDREKAIRIVAKHMGMDVRKLLIELPCNDNLISRVSLTETAIRQTREECAKMVEGLEGKELFTDTHSVVLTDQEAKAVSAAIRKAGEA